MRSWQQARGFGGRTLPTTVLKVQIAAMRSQEQSSSFFSYGLDSRSNDRFFSRFFLSFYFSVVKKIKNKIKE